MRGRRIGSRWSPKPQPPEPPVLPPPEPLALAPLLLVTLKVLESVLTSHGFSRMVPPGCGPAPGGKLLPPPGASGLVLDPTAKMQDPNVLEPVARPVGAVMENWLALPLKAKVVG